MLPLCYVLLQYLCCFIYVCMLYFSVYISASPINSLRVVSRMSTKGSINVFIALNSNVTSSASPHFCAECLFPMDDSPPCRTACVPVGSVVHRKESELGSSADSITEPADKASAKELLLIVGFLTYIM